MNVQSFPLAQLVPVPTSHWDGSLAADIFAPDGTPVLAVFDGYADAYTVPAGGNAITLTAADGSAAYYAHLQSPGVSGPVVAGQVLGYEGHTGNADKGGGSSDSHLHFALATSPGVIAATGGAGDIAPWDALAGVGVVDVGGPTPSAGVDGGQGGGAAALFALAAGAVLILLRRR